MSAAEVVHQAAESALQMRWVMTDEGLRIHWTTAPMTTSTAEVVSFEELQERRAEAA
jgi:hypothetical protein